MLDQIHVIIIIMSLVGLFAVLALAGCIYGVLSDVNGYARRQQDNELRAIGGS